MAVSGVGGVAVPAENTAYGHIVTTSIDVESDVMVEGGTELAVREYFKDIPVMIQIARCESHFRHTLADGSVLQGRVDSADTGVMQINKRYHLKTANNHCLDITELEDNMAYARHLYEKQGTQHWSASAPCWRGNLALAK